MSSRFSRTVASIEANLDDPSVKFQLGSVKNQEHTQRRRVVWVRAGGDVRPPERTGAKVNSGDRVKQPYTLHDRVEAHIYAEDDELTEQLMHNVLAAANLAAGRSIVPLSYRWPTEEVGKADISVRQPKVVLLLEFHVPVLDTRERLTTIAAFQHTGTFEGEEVC